MDEAIIRIIVQEGEGGSGPASAGPVPPEPGNRDYTYEAESSSSMVVASARALRLAVDTLTADISRASVALRALPRPQAAAAALPAPATSKPLALPYYPQQSQQLVEPTTGTPYERLKALHGQYRLKLSQEELHAPASLHHEPRSQKELEAYYAEMDAIAKEHAAILDSAGLTERERQVADSVFLGGMKKSDAASDLGIHKTRVGQLSEAMLRKLGVPIPEQLAIEPAPEMSQHAKYAAEYEAFVASKTGQAQPVAATPQLGLLDLLEAQGREQAEKDQEAAGSNVAFNREPTEAKYTSKVPGAEKLVKKLTSAWMKATKDPELQAQITAALAQLTHTQVDPTAIKASLKAGSIPEALAALAGAPHMAEGGWLWEDVASGRVSLPEGRATHIGEDGLIYLNDLPKLDAEQERALASEPEDWQHSVRSGKSKYTTDDYIAWLDEQWDDQQDAGILKPNFFAGAEKLAEGEHFAEGGEFAAGDYGMLDDADAMEAIDAANRKLELDEWSANWQPKSAEERAATRAADQAHIAEVAARLEQMLAKYSDQSGMENLAGILWRDFPGGEHYATGTTDMTRGGVMPNQGHAESGTDWHRAFLTNKEFVVNQHSTAANLSALHAANANPDVRLEAKHAATGGVMRSGMFFGTQAGMYAEELFDQLGLTSASVGPQGPVPPTIMPQTMSMITGLVSTLTGPVGQAAMLAGYMVGQAQEKLHDAVIGSVASLGEWSRALADPDANPSKLFSGYGEMLSGAGEKVSDTVNKAFNPIGSMLGIDLIPPVKIFSGAVGEASKQLGAFMDAIHATAARYGDLNPEIAAAQAMVEVKQVMGDMRRARESGPELARYLRAQGDLQQKVEDIKIKLLTKLLPLVTNIVSIVEGVMPAGEGIAMAVQALVAPLVTATEVLNRIAHIQEDATKPRVGDPTDALFRHEGQLQGQGVGVPNA